MKDNFNPESEINRSETPSFRVVVIGASAGGLNALTELVNYLPTDTPLALFVVLHLARKGIGDVLVYRLQPHTSFTCKLAVDEEPIQPNIIYLASPDQHLLVKADGRVAIGRGPTENRWRPSIDVLFRSAAVAYGPRVIGIILTGLLDDGSAGMMAIQKCGGITIVQDPNEAEFPDMPLAVLDNMDVNYCLPLAEMGRYLQAISQEPLPVTVDIPADLLAESQISENVAIGIQYPRELGEKSLFSCPDCGGGLWEITENHLHRYRCHIGHAYSEQDLAVKQSEATEATLWVALRMMEERRNMLMKMADQYRRRGLARLSSDYDEKVTAVKIHIDRLKEILFATQNT